MSEEKSGWVFVREVRTNDYTLQEVRKQHLHPERVRTAGVGLVDGTIGDDGVIGGHHSAKSHAAWTFAPGDEPFLTQSLEVHFVELPPQSSNHGHGHQNEAPFYILEGRGYDIHDGERYDWQAGDLLWVHTDSVHKHYNPYDERALTITFKAKSTWIFLGLVQQGHNDTYPDHPDYGPRVDWSQLWLPGVESRSKIVRSSELEWQEHELGKMKVLTGPETPDVRGFSVDVYQLLLDESTGGRSAKRWRMGDEIVYILDGEGYCLHWDVRPEIADRYYAHIAKEPVRIDFKKGEMIYNPPNTIVQYFSNDGSPLQLLVSSNSMFRHLGYAPLVIVDDDIIPA